ncbi:RidA family protein [Kribbella sp. NPDC026611]|uniref:RidA family protein n=1 Tax=Kribbella sp. NPDC026611 TaxID=3154911 RepID=UPI0033C4961C
MPDRPLFDVSLVPLTMVYEVGNTIFVSGHIPIEPDGRLSSGDIAHQTDLVLLTIRERLEQIGSGFDDVVKVTVLLADAVRDFPVMNEVYGRHFSTLPRPSRTTLGVQLAVDVLIEVEMIAVRGHRV